MVLGVFSENYRLWWSGRESSKKSVQTMVLYGHFKDHVDNSYPARMSNMERQIVVIVIFYS